METGFMNFHDEVHYSSNLNDQGVGFDNQNTIFSGNISDYDLESFNLQWEHEQTVTKVKQEHITHEDYEKTFNDWNQHLKEFGSDLRYESVLDDVAFLGPGYTVTPLAAVASPLVQPTLPPKVEIKEEPLDEEDEVEEEEDEELGEEVRLKQEEEEEETRVKLEEEEEETRVKLDEEEEDEEEEDEDEEDWVEVKQEEEEEEEEESRVKQEPLGVSFSLQGSPLQGALSPTSPSNNTFLDPFTLPDSPIAANPTGRDLEAGDLDTLLKRFEAASVPREATAEGPGGADEQLQPASPGLPAAPPRPSPPPHIVNKSIKDALPKEVIERIRESCKKRKNACNRSADDAALPACQPNKVTINGEGRCEMAELDHNYCFREEGSLGGGSRKDSGLESGELTDSSSQGSPGSVPQASNTPAVKEERKVEESEGTKKKKKLKLEEYRERRKNMKPEPVPDVETRSEKILVQDVKPEIKTENKKVVADAKRAMISVEVQTEVREAKKEPEVKVDEELERKKEMWLDTMKRTYRSSSSEDDESSCSSRRRTHSSRRYKRSSGRRPWTSRSRTRSRSRSTYLSSSRSPHSSSSRSSSASSRGRSRSSNRRRRHSFTRTKKHSASGRYKREWSVEKQRQVEERRVIYVGQIEEGTTKHQLRDRFHRFGQILDISLHFRERGDNYGFVTFKYPSDAYQAVEHGNDYGLLPQYEICFGGRRAFCKQRYSDLDNVGGQPYGGIRCSGGGGVMRQPTGGNTFDMLLREAQENLRKRSTV